MVLAYWLWLSIQWNTKLTSEQGNCHFLSPFSLNWIVIDNSNSLSLSRSFSPYFRINFTPIISPFRWGFFIITVGDCPNKACKPASPDGWNKRKLWNEVVALPDSRSRMIWNELMCSDWWIKIIHFFPPSVKPSQFFSKYIWYLIVYFRSADSNFQEQLMIYSSDILQVTCHSRKVNNSFKVSSFFTQTGKYRFIHGASFVPAIGSRSDTGYVFLFEA